MHVDVAQLGEFYWNSRLGAIAGVAVRDAVFEMAPRGRIGSVAGFGFATPLLERPVWKAQRTIALMPGQQGVMRWPDSRRNVSVLAEETLWPLPGDSLDLLLVMHGLEACESPGALVRECWRVLKPEARAYFIVPNRLGLWAKRDLTPFGHGRPYSLGQLEDLLRSGDFEVARHAARLFFPPREKGFWAKTSGFWERAGRLTSLYIAGGILIQEAVKREPAPLSPGAEPALASPLRILEGIARPAPSARDSLGMRPAPAK